MVRPCGLHRPGRVGGQACGGWLVGLPPTQGRVAVVWRLAPAMYGLGVGGGAAEFLMGGLPRAAEVVILVAVWG